MTVEQVSTELASQGFHVGLKRRQTDWEATLWNNVTTPHCLPMAFGATCLEAIEGAVAVKDKAIAEKRTVLK